MGVSRREGAKEVDGSRSRQLKKTTMLRQRLKEGGEESQLSHSAETKKDRGETSFPVFFALCDTACC